jgi:hypothetical protein
VAGRASQPHSEAGVTFPQRRLCPDYLSPEVCVSIASVFPPHRKHSLIDQKDIKNQIRAAGENTQVVDLTMLNTLDTIHGHIPHPVLSCIVSRTVMHRIPCSSCIASRAVMHRIPCLFSAFPLGQIAFLTGCDGITSLGHHKIGVRINLPCLKSAHIL